MVNGPILTIAIPTFNRAIWLDETLEILDQELKYIDNYFNIEVLISNNASTDNTSAVLQHYGGSKVFEFFEQNQNIGAVKNIMFLAERARGKYLWILGDDDFIYKGFLQKLLKVMHNNLNVLLVFIEMVVWYPDKDIRSKEELKSSLHLNNFYEKSYLNEDLIYKFYSKAAEIADPDRGYFNAIGNIILLKEHYLKAFEIGVASGPEFTSIESTFPHAHFIAKNLLDKSCVHIISPGTYCSHGISWKKYYEITYLKWYPELFMLMADNGASVSRANVGRKKLFSKYTGMLPRIISRKAGNYQYFSFIDFIKNNYRFLEFWILLLSLGKSFLYYYTGILKKKIN